MNLIMVEGLPGMGKTSTAKAIHNYLISHKDPSEVFYETSIECPVAQPWSFERAREIIADTTLAKYPYRRIYRLGFLESYYVNLLSKT